MREAKREGEERRREGTGRGARETGAWRLKRRSDYTGKGELQVECDAACV